MSEDLSYLAPSDTPQDDVLRELGAKVKQLQSKRQEIAFMEEKLKELNKEERELSGEEIPTILLSRGLSLVKLDTGEKVEIVEKLAASIPKDPDKRRAIFNWLNKNQGGYLIKDELTVEDPEEHVIQHLRQHGIPFSRVPSVNTNSFKAFLSAQLGMKKGSLQVIEIGDVPKEANPFIYKKTEIK